MLDRLRLDDSRVDALAARSRRRPRSSRSSARSAADARERPRRRASGASRSARSARTSRRGRTSPSTSPAQLLKSLNTGVLRTGGAALRTVTVLVDEVLRPALERAGLPPAAIGLVRSPDHEGARALVSLPQLVPLVILRGSGRDDGGARAARRRERRPTLAHAEGGGVLYVHAAAVAEQALALAEASLDRLGVCNRLNLALVDRGAAASLPDAARALPGAGLEVRGDAR